MMLEENSEKKKLFQNLKELPVLWGLAAELVVHAVHLLVDAARSVPAVLDVSLERGLQRTQCKPWS